MGILVASKLPRMIVYIEPELKEAAEALAKKQRRSVSSLVCLLLEEAVQKSAKTLPDSDTKESIK